MTHSSCFFFVIFVHQFLFLICFVLNNITARCSSEKSSRSHKFFGFPASFAYLNPFQQWLYDFEIHLFTRKTTKGPICNYYKRLKCHWCFRRKNSALTVHSHRLRREHQNSPWPQRYRKIRGCSDVDQMLVIFKGAAKQTSLLILCRLTSSRV